MKTRPTVQLGLAALLVLAASSPLAAQGWHVDVRAGGVRVAVGGAYPREAFENGYRRGIIRGEIDARAGRFGRYADDREYRGGDWGFMIRFGSRDRYRRGFRAGLEVGYRAGFGRFGSGGRYGYGRAVPRGDYPDPPVYPNDYGYRGYGSDPNDRRYPDSGGYGEAGRYPDGAPAPNAGAYGAYPEPGYGNDGGQVGEVPFRNGYADGLEKGEKDARGRKSYDLLRHDWYRDGDRHYDSDYGPRDQYRQAYRAGFQQGYDEAYRGGSR